MTTTLENTDFQLHQGHALHLLGQMPAASVEMIATDPAYWTLNKWREIGTTTRLGGNRDEQKRDGWFETIDQTELWELICECARVLPKNGHCWMMGDGEVMSIICGMVREGEAGFDYVKPYPVLKRAGTGNYRAGMGYHLRGCHEYVVLLEKGRRRFPKELEALPDVFDFLWNGDAETRAFTQNGKPYPTAKPLALFRQLIELSSIEGETVLDPFLGSGTAVLAALQTNRKGVGIDVKSDALETTRRLVAAWRSEQASILPELRQ